MLGLGKVARKVFGTANERKVKALRPVIAKINAFEAEIAAQSDAQMIERTEALKARAAAGESLDALLPEAFANAREAAKRVLGLRPFDVQLIGGIFLHQGNIAEMKTGEGKTLMATLPAYLNALSGRPVHIVTVNDYLAARDAEWMGRVYAALGLTTGVITSFAPSAQDPAGIEAERQAHDAAKAAAYQCDILYGTNNELGFDYLRDNLKSRLKDMVQHDHYFAIVDEVDSILIDEARTPLIISGPSEDRSELYKTADAIVPELSEEHYSIDEKTRQATLTEEGNDFVEEHLKAAGHLAAEASLYDPESVSLVHHINNALRAHKLYLKDKDYIVRAGQVMLIDEFSGRIMDGRRLGDGLHQAIEAKEAVEIKPENITLASVTYQNYFRLYEKLAGMTGTALTEAEEFGQIYGLGVVDVPTNRPVARIDEHDAIYRSAKEKYEAIVIEVAQAHAKGQPTLVGTTSIEKSESLSKLLKDTALLKRLAKRLKEQAAELKKEDERAALLEEAAALEALGGQKDGIKHNVLNARFHEQEAAIIAEAGIPGAVTIATNMAGRGTDIQLGGNVETRFAALVAEHPQMDPAEARARVEAEVAEDKTKALAAGGLFVLGTERHESRRIDNQLRGRSGRQGDPGRSAFFLSLEDDLMRIFGSERLDKVLSTLGMAEGEAIVHPWVNKSLERAQAKVEGRNFDMRKQLLKFDDVMNEQRKAIFGQRREIMESEDLSETVADMREQVIEDLMAEHVPPKSYPEQWDLEGLSRQIREIFSLDLPIEAWADEDGVDADEIAARLERAASEQHARKVAHYGPEIMRDIEKQVLLQTIDRKWREHLLMLEHLRSVVGFRGYAQRDPLNEYKTEAFGLFEALLEGLRMDICRQLAHIRVLTQEEQQQMMMAEAQRAQAAQEAPEEITPPASRNALCPCGSGLKYKHCHGKL